jgi:maleamate amidohydrolase
MAARPLQGIGESMSGDAIRAVAKPPWDGLISPEDIEVYRRAGFLKTYGLGKKPALLVVDVEVGFVGDDPRDSLLESIEKYGHSCGPFARKSIPYIQGLLAKCRALGIPIAFSHGRTEVIPELEPQDGELVFRKYGASPFTGTPLLKNLIQWNVDTVIQTGCTTSGCVRASVVDARDLGFLNAIVEECCFDRAMTPHLVNLFDMDAKYGDVMSLGAVEGWLDSLNDSTASDASKHTAVVS